MVQTNLRNGIAAVAFCTAACTSLTPRQLPPPTPEAVTAHLQPLAIAAHRMDILAGTDPAYAGTYLDEVSRRVVVSFTVNANTAVARYSGDGIYRPRRVRYSLTELRNAEAVATQNVREKVISFHIIALDVQRNRVLVVGLDRRQAVLVRANLGSIRGVKLYFNNGKQAQGEVR